MLSHSSPIPCFIHGHSCCSTRLGFLHVLSPCCMNSPINPSHPDACRDSSHTSTPHSELYKMHSNIPTLEYFGMILHEGLISVLCFPPQVNMDLWFFLLLLGSGLISVGANNVTTGKLCSSSLFNPIFRIKGVGMCSVSHSFCPPCSCNINCWKEADGLQVLINGAHRFSSEKY